MAAHPFPQKETHFCISDDSSGISDSLCLLSAEEVSQNGITFLHDILNTAGGLAGFLELITESNDPAKMKRYAAYSLELCHSLIDEIQYNRQLLLAEKNELNLVLSDTLTLDILQLMILKLKNHSVSKGRTIEIKEDAGITIQTDKVLISRILANMVKNAVEATEEGGVVQIGSRLVGPNIRFWVHNTAFIPKAIQEKMFQRNFSTKGQNRGIGMLSILLLADNLGADVHFQSNEHEGTCFYIDVPLKHEK